MDKVRNPATSLLFNPLWRVLAAAGLSALVTLSAQGWVGKTRSGQNASASSEVRIHASEIRQPIYGFGGSITYNGDLLAGFKGRDDVYKVLFTDLNLDFLRLRNYYDYEGQEAGFEAKTREFAMGAIRWSAAKLRNGKAPVRLMFTAWSPPAYLKSNHLVSGKSNGTDKGLENATLRRNPDGRYAYAEYADWWLASLRKFKDVVGVYPDYIALQNELDISVKYEGCLFLPTEGSTPQGYGLAGYDQALTAVSDRLKGALGRTAPRIIGPETFTIRRDSGRSEVVTFVDPSTKVGKNEMDRLFGISFHIYGSGAETGETQKFHDALDEVRKTYRPEAGGKPLFQTEFLEGNPLIQQATMISDTFTRGGASAYFAWISARESTKPGFAFVYYNTTDGSIEKRDRFYAFKHFSAFVGEGWNRIGCDCGDATILNSAYVDATRKHLVAVLINPSDTEKRIVLSPDGNRFRNATTTAYRSSAGDHGERWRELGPLGPDRGVPLLPHSIVTVRFERT
jgi:O-glycosyl hydrolase